MSNKKDYRCVLKVKKKKGGWPKKECRHWIECDENKNCSIIAADDGPRTLQNIGDYYGISRMRVCQIEKSLLEKLKNSKVFADFDPSS